MSHDNLVSMNNNLTRLFFCISEKESFDNQPLEIFYSFVKELGEVYRR